MLELVLSLILAVTASFLSHAVGRSVSERRVVWPFGREQTLAALYNLGLFLAMLVGILANYFYVHGVNPPVDWNVFWKPVLISPVMFLVVYVGATKQPRGLIPILVAFQNGFFWQTVLEKAHP